MTPAVDDVIGYLRANGWEVTDRWRSAEVWSWHEFDVLVPPTDQVPDKMTRLRELARCVADAEGRSPTAVLRDMTTATADVISYRAQQHESVSLPTGVSTVQAAWALLNVAAREVVADDDVYAAHHKQETIRHLMADTRMALLDDTFGLEFAFPFEAGELNPLGRKVVIRVLDHSTRILRAATQTTTFTELPDEEFPDAVWSAMADLAGPEHPTPFVLDFRWSRHAPRAREALTFPLRAAERISAATRNAAPKRQESRSRADQQEFGVIEGPVTSLADDETGVRWQIKVRGTLTADDVASGTRRQVPVLLRNRDDYQDALAAHRDGHTVRVEGPVTRFGRARGITAAPTGFTVIDRPAT
ncbi:hypothetical protein [Nocardia callitridis]|uniref:Uncharacterized protein n=1 Tax=Nocardia callitridis TaxID=648753 RepID=A0ABP9KPG2_9NOCA